MSRRRSSRRRSAPNMAKEDMEDEIDAFHSDRTRVMLNQSDDEASSDSDDRDMAEDARAMRHGKLDLDEEFGSDLSDLDDDEEVIPGSKITAKMLKQQRRNRRGMDSDSDDDDAASVGDGEDDDQGDASAAWGRSKRAYYDADYEDSGLQEDEEIAKEEEEEVKRLQRLKAKAMRSEDFGLDDDSDDDEEDDDDETSAQLRDRIKGKRALKKEAKRKAKQKVVRTRSQPKESVVKLHDYDGWSDESDEEQDNDDDSDGESASSSSSSSSSTPVTTSRSASSQKPSSISFAADSDSDSGSGSDEDDDDASPAEEVISKDLDNLSEEQRMSILISDAPELLGLLNEFAEKSDELRHEVAPLLERARSGELATEKGVSYLEVKYHTLLSYIMNLSFYMVLKANGSTVKDHPVLMQLVRLRTIIEKIKPLDQKLKYQLDKLLRTATQGDAAAGGAADALSHRPNPAALMDDDDDDDDDSDGDSDLDVGTSASAAASSRARAAQEDADAVYRAPKIAAAYFEEERNESARAKEKRREQRKLERAAQHSIMRDLQDELSERPQELRDVGIDDHGLELQETEEDQERARYEEENFVRLQGSKKQDKARRRKQRRQKQIDGLEAFDDFGDLGDFLEKQRLAREGNSRAGFEEDVSKYINKVSAAANQPTRSGDLDVPQRDFAERVAAVDRMRSKKRSYDTRDDGDDALSDDERDPNAPSFFDDDDDAYKRAVQEQARKKQRRKQKYERAPLFAMPDEELEDDEGKRSINYQIAKNKGLTKHRKGLTSRVNNRRKFEKAKKKVKSLRPEMRDRSKPYEGEQTGIRRNLVKGVKF